MELVMAAAELTWREAPLAMRPSGRGPTVSCTVHCRCIEAAAASLNLPRLIRNAIR